MTPPQLSVVVPAFNEAASIVEVVSGVRDACGGISVEVFVVDDGSSDSTGRLAGEAGACVLTHSRTMGYGASLKTGIRAATAPYVITVDGDGQHRPTDIMRLFAERETAEMVVGARTRLLHSPLWRMPGKWLLTRVANYLTGRRIPDLNSGLRLFRRDTVSRYLHICPSGFSFSTTVTLSFLSRGWRVVYVPIDVNQRQGHSTVTVKTGFDTLLLVLRMLALFNPLRIFVPASLLFGAAGVVWAIPFALESRGISVGAMLAIVTAVLLFGLGLLCDQISQLRLERFE